MAEPHRLLLLAGITTRPMASSAARAGWAVTAVDAFGDLDLQACARVVVLPREVGFHPAAAAAAARGLPAAAVAYTSNFENHPAAVGALAAGRRLLGNPPGVLERVRDPVALMLVLRAGGFETPVTRTRPPRPGAGGPRRWLLKPRRSGGGHGTSAWRPGRAVRRHQYLQERIPGIPGSLVFLADGSRALPLALTRQIVGERRFGAGGFRYCGSLVGGGELFPAEQLVRDRASAMAEAVTREFGLVGLNGIDFVARSGVPWPIEVNPRWSASMELLELPRGTPLFALHARACARSLPRAGPRQPAGVRGKAVVFARRAVAAGDTRSWLADAHIADIPQPGARILRGRPICTVFASASTVSGCLRGLASRAAAIYRAVEPVARGAA